MKCSVPSCNAKAECVPVIHVPAADMPLAEADPVRVIIPTPACEQCAGTLSPSFVFMKAPEIMDSIRGEVTARKIPPRDFLRAFTRQLPLESPEWKAFDKMLRGLQG